MEKRNGALVERSRRKRRSRIRGVASHRTAPPTDAEMKNYHLGGWEESPPGVGDQFAFAIFWRRSWGGGGRLKTGEPLATLLPPRFSSARARGVKSERLVRRQLPKVLKKSPALPEERTKSTGGLTVGRRFGGGLIRTTHR